QSSDAWPRAPRRRVRGQVAPGTKFSRLTWAPGANGVGAALAKRDREPVRARSRLDSCCPGGGDMEVFGVRALLRGLSALRRRFAVLSIAPGLLPLAFAPPAAFATTISSSRIAPGCADLPLADVFVAAVVVGALAGRRRSIRAMLAPDGRSRLRGVVESRMLAMTFWDARGQISEPNDPFLELIGYARAALGRRPVRWQGSTPAASLDAAGGAAAGLHAGGRCAQFEMECSTKAGRRVPILVGAALLEGDEKGAVSFALDLTECRRGGTRMWQADCVRDEY